MLSHALFVDNRVLSQHSIELIDRVKDSYDEYFRGKIPNDRLLSMMISPLHATLGADELVGLLDEGQELVAKGKSLLTNYIKHLMRAKDDTDENTSDNAETEADGMSCAYCCY
jgi:hypothetical protein